MDIQGTFDDRFSGVREAFEAKFTAPSQGVRNLEFLADLWPA